MLPSKLNLIGRDLEDVHREFIVLINKLSIYNDKPMSDQQKKYFNEDLNGWINWIESLKK